MYDPYRWLEDSDSGETRQFVDAQNKFSQPYLSDDTKWQEINNKLMSLWNYAKYDVPKRYGKYYFSSMNTGLQNQKYVLKTNRYLAFKN